MPHTSLIILYGSRHSAVALVVNGKATKLYISLHLVHSSEYTGKYSLLLFEMSLPDGSTYNTSTKYNVLRLKEYDIFVFVY